MITRCKAAESLQSDLLNIGNTAKRVADHHDTVFLLGEPCIAAWHSLTGRVLAARGAVIRTETYPAIIVGVITFQGEEWRQLDCLAVLSSAFTAEAWPPLPLIIIRSDGLRIPCGSETCYH